MIEQLKKQTKKQPKIIVSIFVIYTENKIIRIHNYLKFLINDQILTMNYDEYIRIDHLHQLYLNLFNHFFHFNV